MTTIEAHSALRAREYGRQLNRSYAAGTRVGTVIRDLISTLELGEGTLASEIQNFQLEGVGGQFRAPFSVTGPAWESLVQMLQQNGLRVTTEGDDLVTFGVDDALRRTAIVLNENTGLRGTPTADRRGLVTFEAAMIPGLIPGRQVKIESELLTSQCRVNSCIYSGSLYGSEFGAKCEGRVVT